MLRASLGLFKNAKLLSSQQLPSIQSIIIPHYLPPIIPNYINHQEPLINNYEEYIGRNYPLKDQELVITGQPIIECRHKPKELARRKRKRRKTGAKISARWK